MSIQSEINRIAGAKSDIADAIEDQGVTVPSGTKLDRMANLIGQISGGSGKLNSTQAADAYDPTATYAVGDKVSYAGNVYSCISAISTPEDWDSTHWDQVDPIQDQVDEVRNILNSEIATRQTYVRPNLLDNWYFVGGGSQLGDGVFPINQRGQTTYSNAGYGIDRWTLQPGVQCTLNADYITVKESGNYVNFMQIIKTDLGGEKLTLSILTTDGCFSVSFIASPTSSFQLIHTSEYNVSMYLRVNANNGKTEVALFAGAGATDYPVQINVIAVKLELGSGQTLAHNEGTDANPVWVLNEIPNYGEELFKCGTSTADSADPYANKTYNKVFSAKNRIEASEDFNNYRGINAIGFYSTNGMPTNAPASFGTLLVFQSASSSGCTQMYLAQGKIFVRQYGGKPLSWGSWRSISLS